MTSLRAVAIELDPQPGEYPTAVTTARWVRTRTYSSGGYWALTARCPYPGPKGKLHHHQHGGRANPRRITLGHRLSDCMPGGGYYLELDMSAPISGPVNP